MFRDYRYVENYPGYIISNFGEVFSTKRGSGKQLKANPRNGYLSIGLYKNGKGKNHTIHALVGNAFIGLRNGEITFDHIDRDKLNNRADNIRLATKLEQNINQGMYNTNKSGLKNIFEIIDKRSGYVYYILKIERGGKKITNRSLNKTKYTLDDVVKMRDDLLAKYNHNVLLNKVHIELSRVKYLVRSV